MTNENKGMDGVGCIFTTFLLALAGVTLWGIGSTIKENGYKKGIKEITSKHIYQKNIERRNLLKQGDATYIQINDSTYIPFKEFQSRELDSLNAQRKNIEDKLKGGK